MTVADISDLFTGGGVAILSLLTLIQIAPIKVNPWHSILRFVGRALNGEVMDRLDRTEAETARRWILRFNDEIRLGQKHTYEHFIQTLDDIDTYEHYCAKHPDYQNSKAVAAIKNVRDTYAECNADNNFL